MSWNGAGTFNRLFSWVADAAAAINISSSRMDADSNDIVSNGFGNCLTRDGQGAATASLPMNGFRHTGVGNAVNRTDYAALGQVQDGIGLNWTIAGGSADALTATYTPALTALTDGQLCFVRAVNANATTTPTFAPNGLTARTITKNGGAALLAGDIAGNLVEIVLRYNFANTRWELLNPAQPNPQAVNPTGAVVAFAGAAAPVGYLICDGSSQLRAGALAALFAVIGTTYGSADGSHFNLPDLRGRVIAALDSGGSGRITVAGGNFDGTVLGGSGGLQNETLTAAQLPVITPTVSSAVLVNSNIPVNASTTQYVIGAGSSAINATVVGTENVNVTMNSFGSGNSHPNVQPTMMMNYIIKT
jgi:microcystin-dependent protein